MTVFRSFGEAPPCEREALVTGGSWFVPTETPVAFVYNRRNYAVMLSTPADMEDFAVGFSLTERIVDKIDDIASVEIHQNERGIELHLSITPEKLERLDMRQQRRNLVGRAGCGICGLENADVFFEKLPKVSEKRIEIGREILLRALNAFHTHQPLNEKTKTVHGVAWVSLSGEIVTVREDVGRHNALDKLLGALVRKKVEMADGFVLISSRCSYEMIEKSARLGVLAIASVSGPTSFAIAKAAEANIALYCRNGNGFVLAAP